MANNILKPWYKLPPFLPGTMVSQFITNGEMQFIRMYTEGKTRVYGQFVALYFDVSRFSAPELKEIYDLPFMPTHLSLVKPPAGLEMICGIVKEGNFGGQGIGTQFYFLKQVNETWFKQFRTL